MVSFHIRSREPVYFHFLHLEFILLFSSKPSTVRIHQSSQEPLCRPTPCYLWHHLLWAACIASPLCHNKKNDRSAKSLMKSSDVCLSMKCPISFLKACVWDTGRGSSQSVWTLISHAFAWDFHLFLHTFESRWLSNIFYGLRPRHLLLLMPI